MEFQVIQSGQVIFRHDCPADQVWRYPELTEQALDAFHFKHPEVSLTANDINMKWVLVPWGE